MFARRTATFTLLAALAAGVGTTAASASTDAPPSDAPPSASSAPTAPSAPSAQQPASDTPAPAGAEGEGFASAEEAVSAYLTAFAAGDLTGATATFAIETYVDRFDFEAAVEFVQFYTSFSLGVPLPPGDPLNTAFDVESRRSQVVGQILDQYFALLDPDLDRTRGQVVEDAAEFTESMTTTMSSASLVGLADFEFVALEDVDAESAELYAGRDVENRARRDAVIGADETAAIAVRTTVDGVGVTLLFDAVRYGDAWWLDSLGGRFAVLAGVDPSGAGVFRDDSGDSSEAPDASPADDSER